MSIKLFIIATRQQPSYIFNLINIDEFKESGINISFINITKLQNSVPQDFIVNKQGFNDTIEFYEPSDYTEFYSIAEFDTDDKVYFLFTGWTITNNKILDYCNDNNIHTILLNIIPVNKTSLIYIIYNRIKGFFINRKSLYNSVIVDGNYKKEFHKSIGYSDIWEIHSHVYEEYLKNMNNESTDSYLLYVDQNFSNHPDFKWFDIDVNSFKDYYISINDFLQKQSVLYGLPVKIALHPTSDIELYKKIFHDFELCKGQTFKLMNNAKVIYGHYSNSLDYSILLNKHVILIDINKALSKKLSTNQKIFSRKINLKPINLNTYESIITKGNNDFSNYIDKFIKPKNSLQKSFSTILLEKLEGV